MSEDGESIVIRRYHGGFTPPSFATDAWIRENPTKVVRGVGIDVETNGLNPHTSKVIEVGARAFAFHRETGEILSWGRGYSALQDPGSPLPEEITRLTGISDADVAGQSIEWSEVESIFQESEMVVAHNARFDRAFIDRHVPVSRSKLWACSLGQVDWAAKGYGIRKLEVLSLYHGFFTEAHRALADVEGLLHLLNMKGPGENQTYLVELLENARRPQVRIIASGSPFESKDRLKRRGYYWDKDQRFWYRSIFEDQRSEEIAWLESEVYQGSFRGQAEAIPLVDHFK